jgi:hypothetical protein
MIFRLILTIIATSFFAQFGHAQALTGDAQLIESSAEALGMVRGFGARRRMDAINTVEFSGQGWMNVPQADGSWARFDITNVTVGINYFIPAMRWDMARIDSDGVEQRAIHVIRDNQAWDERLPGVEPTSPSVDQVAERLQQIWLTPHGAIHAAVANPDAVRVESRALGLDVHGIPVRVLLNNDDRPEMVEMSIQHPTLGRTLFEATYTDYIDWPILDVYFPSRIVHTLGGETTLDITVTEFFQNPYVVFPTPELLRRSSQ